MTQSATRATSRPIPLTLTLGGHENWRPSTGDNFRRHFHTTWAISGRTQDIAQDPNNVGAIPTRTSLRWYEL
jgi:hypothetical protein